MVRIAAALTAFVSLCAGAAPEYRTRRDEARKALADNVLVLFASPPGDGESRPGSGQNPNFYYLTGWTEPRAFLLLTSEQEAIFLPKHNRAAERYTGTRVSASDETARTATGFETVFPAERFEAEFRKALESHSDVVAETRGPMYEKLKALAPMRRFSDAETFLGRFRTRKSPEEIKRIQHASDVSVAAHLAAWKRIVPGLFEYQVAATMTYTMLDSGCEGNAYEPIVGAGPNATILHYAQNSRRIEPGEMVLMDVGAQCSEYATDITRTVPSNGRFTARQREVYESVLGAQTAAIAAIKPGTTLADLNKIAREYLEKRGKLSKYLTHRISHGVGLEVHDYPTADFTGPLEAGMVITIEPGVYIPEEKLGIRIEDTILVTGSGSRVMTGALPKAPGEIEKLMAK